MKQTLEKLSCCLLIAALSIWGLVISKAENTYVTAAAPGGTAALLSAANDFTARNRIGNGTAMGAPTGTPSLVEGAAGNVTGTVRYAYYEIDPVGSGKTTLSPYGEITVTNKQVAVTIPLPRKGAGGRVLCRTKAADTATYYILQNIGGDFATTFTDNVLDASLGSQVTNTDTTGLYYLDIRPDVKFIRSHPTDAATADWTFLTGDPASAGSWSIDSYGAIVARSASTSYAFRALTYGTSADAFTLGSSTAAYGSVVTEKFGISGQGIVSLPSDGEVRFSSTTASTGAKDTGLSRISAGLAGVTNGSTGRGKLQTDETHWGDATTVGKLQYDASDVYVGATSNHGVWIKTNNTARVHFQNSNDGTVFTDGDCSFKMSPISGDAGYFGTSTNHRMYVKTNNTARGGITADGKWELGLGAAGISKVLTGTGTLDFGSTVAGTSTDLTITVTGAVDGDVVMLGTPNGSTVANGVFTAWVSASNTVTVRFTNTNLVAALDPASGTFRATVVQH